MNLIDRIKEIAEAEGIPESELIIDEARFFEWFHRGHGHYQIGSLYDENGILNSIDVRCLAIALETEELNRCQEDEFPTSIIYERGDECKYDIEKQKERREKFWMKHEKNN